MQVCVPIYFAVQLLCWLLLWSSFIAMYNSNEVYILARGCEGGLNVTLMVFRCPSGGKEIASVLENERRSSAQRLRKISEKRLPSGEGGGNASSCP